MREQQTADSIAAGLLVALGVAAAAGSVGYGLFDEGGQIGLGFVPFASGILLVVFGGMIGLQTWRSRRHPPENVKEQEVGRVSSDELGAEEPEQEGASDREHAAGRDEQPLNRSVILVFGLTLIAVLVAPLLGFLVSFSLLVFVLIAFVERMRLLYGLGLGIGAFVLAWLVFDLFLQIPLPSGIFAIVGGG